MSLIMDINSKGRDQDPDPDPRNIVGFQGHLTNTESGRKNVITSNVLSIGNYI